MSNMAETVKLSSKKKKTLRLVNQHSLFFPQGFLMHSLVPHRRYIQYSGSVFTNCLLNILCFYTLNKQSRGKGEGLILLYWSYFVHPSVWILFGLYLPNFKNYQLEISYTDRSYHGKVQCIRA